MALGGFFAGGMAEGMNNAEKLDIAQQEADTKRLAVEDARAKATAEYGDRLIAGSMSTISDIFKATAEAGKDPASLVQNKAVQTLLANAKGLAQRFGRDPAALDLQVELLAMRPPATEKEKGPQTELGKIYADVAAGHIPAEEGRAKIQNIIRPLGEVNVLEGIRGKIASGQALTAGEKQVYDDSLKANPLARIIADTIANGGPKPATALPDPLSIR